MPLVRPFPLARLWLALALLVPTAAAADSPPSWVAEHFCSTRPAHNGCITNNLRCAAAPSWTDPTATTCYWVDRAGVPGLPLSCYYLYRRAAAEEVWHYFLDLADRGQPTVIAKVSVVCGRIEGCFLNHKPARRTRINGLDCVQSRQDGEAVCKDDSDPCQ